MPARPSPAARDSWIVFGYQLKPWYAGLLMTALAAWFGGVRVARHYNQSHGWKNGLPTTRMTAPHAHADLSIKKVHLFTDGSSHIDVNKALNPDFEFKTYTEAEGAAYMAKNCPNDLATYNGLKPIAYKADVFRLCALYTEGGIYSDDDLLYLKPLSDLVKDPLSNVLLVYDKPSTGYFGQPVHYCIFNAFMVALRPKLPFFRCGLDLIAENVRARTTDFGSEAMGSLHVSGPQLLWHCIDGSEEQRWLHIGESVSDLDETAVMLHKILYVNRTGGAHYSTFDQSNVSSIYHD